MIARDMIAVSQGQTVSNEFSLIIQAKPSWGVSIINCPFHVITSGVHYDYDVSVLDGAANEKLNTGELLANFVNDSGPKQAIDSMDSLNPEC